MGLSTGLAPSLGKESPSLAEIPSLIHSAPKATEPWHPELPCQLQVLHLHSQHLGLKIGNLVTANASWG